MSFIFCPSGKKDCINLCADPTYNSTMCENSFMSMCEDGSMYYPKTKINHLTFTPEQFLKLIRDLETGDMVYLVNMDLGTVWRGSTRGIYHTIFFVKDPREINEILNQFCPLFKEVKI